MKIKIFLVDDHNVMREGLKLLLERERDFEVLAEADNGRTAVSMVKKLRPDLVIMDISMPDMNGIEATQKIISENPKTQVIALSMYSDKRFVEGMFKAGVSGYLLKNCIARELVTAIRLIAEGQIYLSPKIAGTVVEGYLSNLSKGKYNTGPTLTPREREILQLISEGLSSKEISDKLHVSPKTVDAHRHNIMEKVGVRSIAELTKYAIREGLTSL